MKSPQHNPGTLTEMEGEKEASMTTVKDVDGIFKTRYTQGLMMFFMFFMAFALRLNLSVAIVAMTKSKSANPDFEELDWDVLAKSRVLSAFFWGYLVMQLPAGQLGQVFSVKQLLLWANICCAVLTLLTPAAAVYGGWFLVCIIRLMEGLSQGFYVPLSYNFASKWVPLNERSRFVGFFLNGGTIGAVVSLAVSGVLASGRGGWPSVFYVSGALGLVWSAVWWRVGADSPLTHPTIHPSERQYIHAALNTSHAEKLQTPWKSIFTSVPVWALIGVTIGNGWGFAILLTQLPTYINSVLGFDIGQNGILSALPYLSLWIFSFPVCWFADFLEKRKLLSTVVIRKLFTSLCMVGNAVMVMCLSLAGTNAVAAMTLITLAVTFSAFMFSGFNLNHLDLSPHYAGVLMGLCNGLENISGIMAPLSVGVLVTDEKSVDQWQSVFLLTVAVTLIGNVIYIVWGSADVQPWDSPASASATSAVNLSVSKETVVVE